MARERQADSARRAILARRARFVAAALASSGIAVGTHVAAKPDEDADASDAPADCETDDTFQCRPQICLSDIDIEGELVVPEDAGGRDAPAGEPQSGPLDGPVPHVCLSIAPPSRNLPRQHDGFYLRLSTGPTLMTGTLEGGGSYLGAGLGGGIAVGMTVMPGTVFGLAARLEHAPQATMDSSFGLLELHMGPLVDIYPSARAGFHLALSPEAAVVRVNGSGQDEALGGLGGALWLGYDAWVGEDWSLGLALRGNMAWLHGEHSGLVARNLGLWASVLWH